MQRQIAITLGMALNVLLLAGASTPAYAQAAQSKAEQEIKQRAVDYEKAMLNRDADALAAMMADDMFISDGNGNLIPKSRFIENVKANPNQGKYDDYHFEEMVIHVYGDTAVLNLIIVSKGSSKNGAFNTRTRSTSMVVKKQGRWQIVAFHNSVSKPA
ncbi:MAG: nuclear transport factor 2 family protein [Acidobacteria bacterium]|nr:nuclear transport factor 2 family protein [Acidobacteriota bacterium]